MVDITPCYKYDESTNTIKYWLEVDFDAFVTGSAVEFSKPVIHAVYTQLANVFASQIIQGHINVRDVKCKNGSVSSQETIGV